MTNMKQRLASMIGSEVSFKEDEIRESDDELATLNARLIVERKSLGMEDLKMELKEDFTYSVQALENMLAVEENRNCELKKEIEILKYRKRVLESQFSDTELDA